jgi:hypothetical protein
MTRRGEPSNGLPFWILANQDLEFGVR